MIDFLYAIVSVVVVLGVMIVVHEFGHFAAAKLLGVRVETFSVGFGKRLFGFTRGGTDYRVSALPFGGYVKMAGENPMDERTGDPGEFMSHPRWERFLIAIAGPAMNILLAIALLTLVFKVHYERPVFWDRPAEIGSVLDGSPAEKAGLQPGDTIIRIDDINNPQWQDVAPKILLSPGHPVSLTVQRGNQTLAKTITPEVSGEDQAGEAGWEQAGRNYILAVEAGMPADKAGIKAGDEILSVNNVPVRSPHGIIGLLQNSGGKPVEIAVLRDGRQSTFNVTPAPEEQDGRKQFKIGVIPEFQTKVDSLPLKAAFSRSLDENKRNSVLILDLVKKMVKHEVSMKTMSGPIGIARISGRAARQPGWMPLLMVMAIISLNLGIFNLFPIPILDGGLILLLLIEGLIRRDISQTVKERIYQAAFVCLILFAGVVIFNDVMKLLPSLARHMQ
jgi:regulator of sigma E protease